LTHFLAQRHWDGLMRYFKELAKLPRDVEFEDQVLTACFARAFGMVDASQPDKIDSEKLKRLALEWNSFMESKPLVLADTLKQLHNAELKITNPDAKTP
jgi:hypothetical protein